MRESWHLPPPQKKSIDSNQNTVTSLCFFMRVDYFCFIIIIPILLSPS